MTGLQRVTDESNFFKRHVSPKAASGWVLVCIRQWMNLATNSRQQRDICSYVRPCRHSVRVWLIGHHNDRSKFRLLCYALLSFCCFFFSMLSEDNRQTWIIACWNFCITVTVNESTSIERLTWKCLNFVTAVLKIAATQQTTWSWARALPAVKALLLVCSFVYETYWSHADFILCH